MPDITPLQGTVRAFRGHVVEVVSNADKAPTPRYEEPPATPPGKQDASGKLPMEAPPGNADSNTATLLQLMLLMTEHQQIFKKIFREMRDASSVQQQQLLQDSADSTRAAGQKQMIGGVISGALQIGGGLVSIGMAVRPAPSTSTTGSAIQASTTATNTATKAATDASAAAAAAADASAKAVAAASAKTAAASAKAAADASTNSFVQKNVAYANNLSASFKGIGDTAKSGSDYAATLDHATKQELDAKAEAASRSREQSQDAASQAQANFDKTLSIMGEILANDHAIKKSVIA